MSLPKRMHSRRLEDQALEQALNIKKHDPLTEAYGGVRYSPADIEAIEEERLPWLKQRRAEARRRALNS